VSGRRGREGRRGAEEVERPRFGVWGWDIAFLLLLLELQELHEAGLLACELHVRRGREELRCERVHGRAIEGREFAQLFVGKGCLERPASTDDGDMAYGRAAEDFEHGFGDLVLFERCGRGEQHARNVQRDVSLADDRDVLCVV
jgi:hypothetical protein